MSEIITCIIDNPEDMSSGLSMLAYIISESFGLIGMQLPEKYKENFDVLSECPSLGS
jgi:hypothetical protein